jgi:hypothetical protein
LFQHVCSYVVLPCFAEVRITANVFHEYCVAIVVDSHVVEHLLSFGAIQYGGNGATQHWVCCIGKSQTPHTAWTCKCICSYEVKVIRISGIPCTVFRTKERSDAQRIAVGIQCRARHIVYITKIDKGERGARCRNRCACFSQHA